MFAKLSALALCTSFVSALQMALPPSVAPGSTATIYATPESGDPTQVTLVLTEVDTAVAYATATVNVGTEMTLDIPSGLTPTAPFYVVYAFDTDINVDTIYGASNVFIIS